MNSALVNKIYKIALVKGFFWGFLAASLLGLVIRYFDAYLIKF